MLLSRLGVIIIPLLLLRFTPYNGLEEFKKREYSLEILDRNGTLLYTTPIKNGLLRERVDSGKLPREVIATILESEDRFFYLHPGVNPISLIRSSFTNLKEGRIVSGASTISMQLARIITPRDKSLKSKIMEMVDALKLESRLSKGEILSLYLSNIPFGDTYGYGSASKKFFYKPLHDLNREEIAIISVIPRNPTANNPFSRREGVSKAVNRSFKDIDSDKVVKTLNTITQGRRNPIKAPHFVYNILKELKQEEFIRGEAIVTTLDYNVQLGINDLLKTKLQEHRGNRISNGAILLTYKGEILAYIGSGDFFNSENGGQIDGIRIKRQPGSTLKPYLYELAFEMGFTPSSILPDIPTIFGKREVYRPENYSQTYHGPVDFRTSLASSLNIPAVYLLERVGVKNFISRLKELGFDSLKGQEESLGLGLAVGNAEVSLYELTRAFDSFKNRGEYKDLIWRLGGEVSSRKVMDPQHSAITRDILMDRQARVLGFGRNSVINTNYPAFFKTGTSNQFNNIWALGATKDLTCGVWMGNFSGETVIGTPGSSIPAAIAETILDEFSSKEAFEEIENVHRVEVCTLSGGIPGAYCTNTRFEIFKYGSKPGECDYHTLEGVVLPSVYSTWLSIYGYDNYSWGGEGFQVKSPTDGATYYYSPNIPIESQGVEFNIVGSGNFKVMGKGEVLLNGDLPYRGILPLEKGEWKLEIINRDSTVERLIYLY